MAIARVVNNNGSLELETLSGAIASGLPLGTIISLPYGTVTPQGFLPCDGSAFNINTYPALYTYLQSANVPDLREMTLVGAGQNTTDVIASHDVYAGMQFKDDQLQEHNHNICVEGDGEYSCYQLINTDSAEVSSGSNCDYGRCNISVGSVINARTGNTTHGKQKGVFYYIKAVTGWVDIDDATVYGEVVELLQANYLDKTVLTDKAIVSYDEASGELSSIPLPVGGNKILVAAPDGTYSWSDPAMGAVWNSPDVCATINTCYREGCLGNASDFRFIANAGGTSHSIMLGCDNTISDTGFNYLGNTSSNPDFGSVYTGIRQDYCKISIGEDLQLSNDDCDYHISMGFCNGFYNYGGTTGTCTLTAGNANIFLGNSNMLGFCSGDAYGWDYYLGNNNFNIFIGSDNNFKTKVDEECTNAHLRNIVLGNGNTGYISASNIITGNNNNFCGDCWEPMGGVVVYGNRNTLCNSGDYSSRHIVIGTCNSELSGCYGNIIIGDNNKACCGNQMTYIGTNNCSYGCGVGGGVAMGNCALIGRINSAVWVMEHHRYTEGGPHGTIRFHIPANQMNCDIRAGLRCLMKDFINRGWCDCTWTCQGVGGSYNVPTTKGRITGYYYINSNGQNNVGNNTICKWDDIVYIDGTGNTACSQTSVATWIDSCNCTVRTQCFTWADNTNRWGCGLSGTLFY